MADALDGIEACNLKQERLDKKFKEIDEVVEGELAAINDQVLKIRDIMGEFKDSGFVNKEPDQFIEHLLAGMESLKASLKDAKLAKDLEYAQERTKAYKKLEDGKGAFEEVESIDAQVKWDEQVV